MAEEKTDPKSLQQAVREAWLGLMASAESEWHKASHKVLEALGVPEGGSLGAELVARMRKNRDELERRIDEGVKAAVAKVRAPIDKEIQTFKARVERIQARIDEQKQKRAEKKKG